ncbi:MAG: threonine/serine dehydratase [Gemmatimonadota bacterium]|nr:threonine/serine dehydratase [Gemmatimonadota bacterium]
MLPSPADVLAAALRLRGIIERTPLLHSPTLSDAAGCDVHLKCENLQRTGAFKLRGAYNALASLSPEVRSRGVVASSAGNHGLGLALSAHLLGVRARVFVPHGAPTVKRDGILALGAEVDETQADYDAAHAAAVAYARSHGMTFVNPCAGAPLLAGQGTVALEILEELPALRSVVVPVGGAGLVGGMSVLLRAVSPNVRIVGAQTENTSAMAACLDAGQRVDVELRSTIAEGLAGQMDDEGFAIGQMAIDEMAVVSEDETARAIAWASREHDLRVEGSGAVGIAALLCERASPHEGPIAVVVTGGNIDDARWRSITGR